MKMTYLAYKGYFQNGRFVLPKTANIPENVIVYVIVVGEEDEFFLSVPRGQKTDAPSRLVAIRKIMEETSKIKTEEDTLTEADWGELENLRSLTDFSRVLNL